MTWLNENLGTLVVALAIAALAAWAVVRMVRQKRKGGCASCDGCGHAHACSDAKHNTP